MTKRIVGMLRKVDGLKTCIVCKYKTKFAIPTDIITYKDKKKILDKGFVGTICYARSRMHSDRVTK